MDGGIKGYTTRIIEYARVEGLILRPAETVVRYGTLLEVADQSQGGKRFLAMVSNVKEETTHPAVDVERFRELYLKLAEARLEDANRVIEELMSPQQDLIRWNSIMTVELRVLGEITGRGLAGYDRPPRPLSRIAEPEPRELEAIIHSGLEDYESRGVYVGRLAAAPQVRVYLNMERFTMHLSILAQTGGGKTETVKRLVAETMWRKRLVKPRGGAVVFDVAGEYTGYPYLKPGAHPLLDAVAKPREYGAPEGAGRPEKLTVLVPYASPGWRGLERLRSELADLALRLSGRTGLRWDAVLIRRDDLVDAASGAPLDRPGLAGLLEESEGLVVGLPYPSFMSIQEIVEMSGSRSEYFETIVDETSGILGLADGEEVLSIPALYAVVKLAYTASRQRGQLSPALKRQLRALIEAALTGDPRFEEEARRARSHTLFSYTLPHDFTALANAVRLRAYREERDPGEVLDRMVEDIGEAVESLTTFYDSRTLASVQRGLKKVVLRTSSALDPNMFDAIVERAVEGFTIVHLAPPSMGDVDLLLGLLVRRIFSYHVGVYDPDRLTLLVVEEAHNLAPPGEERASKQALLRVAREGRKWGLSLWLVTQRPSFIDASLLSQTATSILLRTTNPDDLSTIRRGVESVAADVVERLPDLEPARGEALIVGLAAPERRVPLLVSVEMLQRATGHG